MNDQNYALANFNSYKDLTTMNTFTCSESTYGPALIQCFYKLGADRKEI